MDNDNKRLEEGLSEVRLKVDKKAHNIYIINEDDELEADKQKMVNALNDTSHRLINELAKNQELKQIIEKLMYIIKNTLFCEYCHFRENYKDGKDLCDICKNYDKFKLEV